MTATHQRPAGLAVLIASTAIGPGACGGSSYPRVTNLGKGSGNTGRSATARAGSSGAKLAKDNPTRLVEEWADCERSHGDPNETDPTIDAHGVITITIPPPGSGGVPVGDPHDVTGACSQYLAAAQTALRAADPVADPLGMTNQTDLMKYVVCMRADGAPNYPYPPGPNDSETNFNGTGVDPNSPSVVRVSIKCGNELDLPLWWSAGWGPPGDVTVHMSLPPGAPARRAPVAATGALNIGAPEVPRVSNANSQAAGGG